MPAIPDFTARAWQTTRETPQLSISILDGKGTLMPPWRSKLTLEQARDLAVYVRNFGPADLLTAEITPTQFGNRFRDLKKQWDELEQQARSLPHP
jgi:mono/diheme cytochrome c family protein